MEKRSPKGQTKFEANVITEPQIDSESPEERKAARALRIQRRLNAIKKDGESETVTIETEVVGDPLADTILSCNQQLQEVKVEAEEFVTNVQVANDSREADRRELEGLNREKILKSLNDEAEEAQRKFDEIAMKWTGIMQYKDPLHIHEDIISQKEKCDLLIKQKDDFIAKLKEQVKIAEKRFADDQIQQNNDIRNLTQRIENQISCMKKAFRTQFDIIEETVMKKRSSVLDSINSKWEKLYEKRDTEEAMNYEKKEQQIAEFEEKMIWARKEFQEHFRETKIQLENNIEHLQRELERIKALVLLNSEKLDYNYQILKKREDENLIMKSQQKRRINKLKDNINDLRRKIQNYEEESSNKMKKLTEYIDKYKRSIDEVESKADYFAKVNEKNFQAVWDMNTEMCIEILQDIFDIDKIFYEQMLGLDWQPPNMNIIDKNNLPSYKKAQQTLNPQRFGIGSVSDKESVIGHKSSIKITKKHSKMTRGDINNATFREFIHILFKKISDKSGFLADKDIRMLLEPYVQMQKSLIRIDHIFVALGISNKEGCELLIQYFLPFTYCSICADYEIKSDSKDIEKSMTEIHFSGQQSSYNVDNTGDMMDFQNVISSCVALPDETVNNITDRMVESSVGPSFSSFHAEPIDDNHVQDVECGAPDKIGYGKSNQQTKKISQVHSKTIHFDTSLDISCENNHPLTISSVYVPQVLKNFIQDFRDLDESKPTVTNRMNSKRLTISRMLSPEDIDTFWIRYKNIFGPDRAKIWDGLMQGLKRFYDVLLDRKQLSEEVVILRQKNRELKRLLENYAVSSDILKNPCDNTKYFNKH